MSWWAILFVAASAVLVAYAALVAVLDDKLRQSLLRRIPRDAAEAKPPLSTEEWDRPLAEYADRVDALSRLWRELSRSGLAAIALVLAALLLSVPAALLLVDETRDGSPSVATSASGGPWLGTYHELENPKAFHAYRVYGGSSGPVGRWLTTVRPRKASEAVDGLALPPGNYAVCVAEITVPPGARLRIGVAAPLWGHPGGWSQIEVVGDTDDLEVDDLMPLPPSTESCEA